MGKRIAMLIPSMNYARSGEWGDHVTLQAAADSVWATNFIINKNLSLKKLCCDRTYMITDLLFLDLIFLVA